MLQAVQLVDPGVEIDCTEVENGWGDWVWIVCSYDNFKESTQILNPRLQHNQNQFYSQSLLLHLPAVAAFFSSLMVIFWLIDLKFGGIFSKNTNDWNALDRLIWEKPLKICRVFVGKRAPPGLNAILLGKVTRDYVCIFPREICDCQVGFGEIFGPMSLFECTKLCAHQIHKRNLIIPDFKRFNKI